MSGHSHWAGIKHKKALTDAKKGREFSRIARQIMIAVQQGESGDANSNSVLRLLMEKARQMNMPGDNVRRAIDKGLGKGGEGRLEEVVYEGYGPFGVGFIVSCVTDNRNRTAAQVRKIMERGGGSIGGPGSVVYLKAIQPMPMIALLGEEKERVLNLVELLEENEDVVEVWTNLEIRD